MNRKDRQKIMAEEEKKTADTGQEEEIQEETSKAEETPEPTENEKTPETDSKTSENTDKKPEEKPGKDDKNTAALKEKIDDLQDRVKRQMAEFENFRRRSDKEKEQRFSMGERNVIEKILPIVDNFERGLAAVPEEEAKSAFAEGMDKIYKQLVKQLTDLGVTPIEAVGHEFDPSLHNAVMQVESEEYGSGIVAREFQKGYMYHDSVLRHSMVGVSK